MPTRGFISHLDLNVSDPAVSIPFYDALLTGLGYEQIDGAVPERARRRRPRRDRGATTTRNPRSYDYSPGYYAVGFDDPDGIRLEVVFDPVTNP